MKTYLLPDDIAQLAAQVIAENLAAGRTSALAESCTGGLVAAALTEIAGSSAVLDRGFVTYSNASKRQMLGVPEDILDTFGAVSIATAWAMAQGALARSDADVAVAISGIAGPDGGTAEQPVGTVCFAWGGRRHSIHSVTLHFQGDRTGVRRQAVLTAIQGLLQDLGSLEVHGA